MQRNVDDVRGAGGDAGKQCAGGRSGRVEEVVVTGSRIITNGNDSPTPVTVVASSSCKRPIRALAQALAQLPALLASPNQGGQGPVPRPSSTCAASTAAAT